MTVAPLRTLESHPRGHVCGRLEAGGSWEGDDVDHPLAPLRAARGWFWRAADHAGRLSCLLFGRGWPEIHLYSGGPLSLWLFSSYQNRLACWGRSVQGKALSTLTLLRHAHATLLPVSRLFVYCFLALRYNFICACLFRGCVSDYDVLRIEWMFAMTCISLVDVLIIIIYILDYAIVFKFWFMNGSI